MMENLGENYTVTATAMPEFSELDHLPDDERRLVLAWRQARKEFRNGRAVVVAAEVDGRMQLFVGHGAGRVLLGM